MAGQFRPADHSKGDANTIGGYMAVHDRPAAFEGSGVGLAPLARLLGEEEFRPVTRTLISGAEATVFGIGLAFGLTHRPRPRI